MTGRMPVIVCHDKGSLGTQAGERCRRLGPAGEKVEDAVHRLQHHAVDSLHDGSLLRAVVPVVDEEVRAGGLDELLHVLDQDARVESHPGTHHEGTEPKLVHGLGEAFLGYLVIVQSITSDLQGLRVGPEVQHLAGIDAMQLDGMCGHVPASLVLRIDSKPLVGGLCRHDDLVLRQVRDDVVPFGTPVAVVW